MSVSDAGGTVTLLDRDEPVCGLCGNNNESPDDDNIGEHLCQYQDLQLMAVRKSFILHTHPTAK